MWVVLPFCMALGVVWHHLAWGRTRRGLGLLVLAFGLLDAFLVRGWVLGFWDGWTRALEIALWVVGAGEVVLLARRKLYMGGRKGREAWRSLFLQGGRHYAQGDGEGAARLFRKAARLNPWSPSPQVWLAFSLLLQGRRGGARRAFKRAAARDRSGDWSHVIRRGLVRTRAKGGEKESPGSAPPRGEGRKGGRKRKVPA